MFYGAGGRAALTFGKTGRKGAIEAAAVLTHAAEGVGRAAWGNPLARRMAIGAAGGAGYGMMSRDTSMLGGAAMGAGIGAGYSTARVTGTARLARQVWSGPGKFTNRAMIAGRVQGALARRYIGNNYTRTMGAIRAL